MRETQKHQSHRHNSNKGPWEKNSGKSVGMIENSVVSNAEDMREGEDTGGGRDAVLWGYQRSKAGGDGGLQDRRHICGTMVVCRLTGKATASS